MRIISLDLILGTRRLQRRIDAERALLRRDLAVVHENTQQLRTGMVHKATSLPARATTALGGFVVTKLATRPRRPRTEADDEREEREEQKKREPNAALAASTSLAWQVMMPLVISWVQARFAPPEPERHPEDHPTEP